MVDFIGSLRQKGRNFTYQNKCWCIIQCVGYDLNEKYMTETDMVLVIF